MIRSRAGALPQLLTLRVCRPLQRPVEAIGVSFAWRPADRADLEVALRDRAAAALDLRPHPYAERQRAAGRARTRTAGRTR